MITSSPDFGAACAYVRARLETELLPQYGYHSLAHTEEEVVRKAEHLAVLEELTEHEALLLRTAAWFHDIGFIERSDGHEVISVQIARAVLPRMGYDPSDLDRIEEIIMATRLPQSPRTLSAMILADADLDVLSQPHFLQRNKQLREELEAQGKRFSDVEWYRNQFQFLQAHHYFTPSAQKLNAAGKARNIAVLSQLLRQAETANY